MRSLEEIRKKPHVVITDVICDDVGKPCILQGWFDYPDKRIKGLIMAGMNEGSMEHVSVAPERRTQVPDWETICRIKDVFWKDEEMAVQVHPPKSRYVHGVGGPGRERNNILHLWRPVDGDFRLLNMF